MKARAETEAVLDAHRKLAAARSIAMRPQILASARTAMQARDALARNVRGSLGQARASRDQAIISARAEMIAARDRELMTSRLRRYSLSDRNAIAARHEAAFVAERNRIRAEYANVRRGLSSSLDSAPSRVLRSNREAVLEEDRVARRRRSQEARSRSLERELRDQRQSPMRHLRAATASPGSNAGRAYRMLREEGHAVGREARHVIQRVSPSSGAIRQSVHQAFIPVSEMAASGSRSASAWYTGFNSRARSLVSSSGRTIGNALGLAIGVAGGAVAGAALGERLGGETGQMIGGIAGSILGPAFVVTVTNFMATALNPLIIRMKVFTAAVIANNLAWLANPIVWIPMAIMAVVAAVAAAIIYWDKWTAAVKNFLKVIPGVKNLLPEDWKSGADSGQTISNVTNATRGFASELPVAPPAAVDHAVVTNSRNINIQPGAIVVNANSADAEETARLVAREVYSTERRAENLQTASDFDDNIWR